MREKKTSVIVNLSSGDFWSPNAEAPIYASSSPGSRAYPRLWQSSCLRWTSESDGSNRRPENRIPRLKELKMPTIPDARKGTITDYVLQAMANLDSIAAENASKTAEAIGKEVL